MARKRGPTAAQLRERFTKKHGGAGLRVTNLRAFTAALDKLDARFVQELLFEARKMGIRIIRAAKRRAPVDTGQLRASLTWTAGIDRGRAYVRVGTAVRHGRFVEFPDRRVAGRSPAGGGTVARPFTGWRALKGRSGARQTMPFLRPALVDAMRQWALPAVRRALKAASRG